MGGLVAHIGGVAGIIAGVGGIVVGMEGGVAAALALSGVIRVSIAPMVIQITGDSVIVDDNLRGVVLTFGKGSDLVLIV